MFCFFGLVLFGWARLGLVWLFVRHSVFKSTYTFAFFIFAPATSRRLISGFSATRLVSLLFAACRPSANFSPLAYAASYRFALSVQNCCLLILCGCYLLGFASAAHKLKPPAP